MAYDTMVKLSKGGTEEKTLSISRVIIPDLCDIVESIRTRNQVADGPGCADLILECWHKAHDLKQHIQEN